MNATAVWLVGDKRVGVLGSMKVPKTGLGGHDASLLLCVAVMCLLPMVGDGAASCSFESGGVVLLLIGNACPDMACQSMAVLPFALEKMVSGHIANVAQVKVMTAPQWGMLCVMMRLSAVLSGMWLMERRTWWSVGIERNLESASW